MRLTKHHAIPVADSVAERNQFGTPLAAMQEHRAGLRAATTGALACGHIWNVPTVDFRLGDGHQICG
jgi:hypothetical protein